MKVHFKIPVYGLQVFAEGAAGGGTAQGAGVTGSGAGVQHAGVNGSQAAAQAAGQSAAPDAGVQAAADRNAEFEKLIKGDYKDLFEAKVKSIVQGRIKGPSEKAARYDALAPVLDMLGSRYGIQDTSNADALLKALEDDSSYMEAEALKRDMTVDQLKYVMKLERQAASMQRQQREANANRQYAVWMEQAAQTQQIYPSFDLATEMQNKRFQDLIRSNVDVKTAYEVIHMGEIIPAAMQFAGQTVQQLTSNSIASGQSRPKENGSSAQSAAITKRDVSKLTKAERQEIIRQVARGEKITF